MRPSDVGLGVLVAISVAVAAGVVLQAAQSARRADAPAIDPGAGIPIAVRPILDAPAAGRGRGGKGRRAGRASVPRNWQRADPATVAAAVAAVEAAAEASPSPEAVAVTEAASPSTSPSTVPERPSLPELPSLDDLDEPSETVADESAVDPDAPTGGDGGTGGTDGDGGDGSGEGAGDGEGATEGGPSGDPDAAGERAVALYRDRLNRWLSGRFAVTGSGLSREQLRKHRVRAVVRVDAQGTVIDFDVVPSGNAAFDEGARAALESVRGEPVPSPPDDYPEALQSEINVTFVCKESSSCD